MEAKTPYLIELKRDSAPITYSQLVELWKENFSEDWKKAESNFKAGDAMLISGDYNTAITKYSDALNVFPNYYDALNRRGCAYDNSGKSDLALIDYEKAIEVNPVNCSHAH